MTKFWQPKKKGYNQFVPRGNSNICATHALMDRAVKTSPRSGASEEERLIVELGKAQTKLSRGEVLIKEGQSSSTKIRRKLVHICSHPNIVQLTEDKRVKGKLFPWRVCTVCALIEKPHSSEAGYKILDHEPNETTEHLQTGYILLEKKYSLTQDDLICADKCKSGHLVFRESDIGMSSSGYCIPCHSEKMQ